MERKEVALVELESWNWLEERDLEEELHSRRTCKALLLDYMRLEEVEWLRKSRALW